MNTPEEIEAAFKKALKSLDGEKRAAIKKAKGTKGKKSKDAIAAVEEEFASKLKDLQQTREDQLAGLNEKVDEATAGETPVASEAPPPGQQDEVPEKQRKQEKARRKKERQKAREQQKQKEIDEEVANSGPSLREIELGQIQNILNPLNLSIAEVEADGNCMYRAVGAQTNRDYTDVRALCADMLQSNEEEFAPFCEYTDEISRFDQYVDSVRNSSEWGGHLELRAIGMALDRPIHVYSAQSSSEPLTIHESDNAPIRLSYHLHYYALGEHYNQVRETD